MAFAPSAPMREGGAGISEYQTISLCHEGGGRGCHGGQIGASGAGGRSITPGLSPGHTAGVQCHCFGVTRSLLEDSRGLTGGGGGGGLALSQCAHRYLQCTHGGAICGVRGDAGERTRPGGGGGGPNKKQTNANQRQCTPQSGMSASLFSMPNLVEPQDTHCV